MYEKISYISAPTVDCYVCRKPTDELVEIVSPHLWNTLQNGVSENAYYTIINLQINFKFDNILI